MIRLAAVAALALGAMLGGGCDARDGAREHAHAPGHDHGHAREHGGVHDHAPAADAAAHDRRHSHEGGSCTCAIARERGGWCGACGHGFVAGVRVPSAALYDALDAHGHDVDPASIECAACRDALRADGFCAACGFGFVDGQLYSTRLSWDVARGAPLDAHRAQLREAVEIARSHCESCAIVMFTGGTCRAHAAAP